MHKISKRAAGGVIPALVATACFATGEAGSGGSAGSAGSFDVRLRPERDGGEAVTAIAVSTELSGWSPAKGQTFSLGAPIVYAGVTGIADRVEGLTVIDRLGPVDLRIEEDPPAPGGFPYSRHWRAAREVRPPISITYRSRVRPTGERNSPPFGIRPAGGGVSGAGSGFLVLPEVDLVTDIQVRWDLGDLPTSSIAASTFGDGDFELRGVPAELMQGWYMAGPARRFPSSGDARGFAATWLGDEPFDVEAEMTWAAGTYEEFGRFFRTLDPAPSYRVFMRFLATPPFGGGTALGNSFMLSRSAATDEEASPPRRTFAHEMIHQWVGGIEAPDGVSSWFSEGLTTHYTRLLLMRGGHESIETYRSDINEVFRGYFTSSARNLTADSITALGFMDEAARRIPYWRGSLYFADLDARVRAASGGVRDLDAMMFEVFERRARGERFDHDAWITTVVNELGPAERERFDSVILGGETIVPVSDAFGPCLRRAPAKFATDEGEVDGFEWVRVSGVAVEACRS